MNCSSTGIISLDLSKNTALTILNCSNTGIAALDVSENTALTNLNCSNTGIISLDLSENTALTNLYCLKTGITALDVSENTALTNLNCSKTGIISLDLSKNAVLRNVTATPTARIIPLYSGETSCDLNKLVGDLSNVSDVVVGSGTYDGTTGIISFTDISNPIKVTYSYNPQCSSVSGAKMNEPNQCMV